MSRDSPADIRPDPVIEAYREGIDLTLIRENLRLSHEERLRRLQALQRFADELRRSGREAAAVVKNR